MKLGLVTSELFAPGITGIGGFGWATRQVARCFSDDPGLGVECVILKTRHVAPSATVQSTLHGCRILWRTRNLRAHLRQLRREKFDLLLTVDNQAVYRLWYWALPRTPVVFWIHDPWPPEDKALLATVRIPGDPTPPQGLRSSNLRSFRRDHWVSRWLGRRMVFSAPTRLAVVRFPATFGFRPPRIHDLPYIVEMGFRRVAKTVRPSVIVLGRLDPIKRPWIATEVAVRLPEADFHFLGQNHFSGPGSWQPKKTPPNVRFLGHTDGERKTELLSSAWVLLNTSIHEGLPVTFQEALACETPIVSCVDPEGQVSRFGRFVGGADGDGLQLVPKFVEALRGLFADSALRERLGREGRALVETTHNRERFLAAFRGLCVEAGVRI